MVTMPKPKPRGDLPEHCVMCGVSLLGRLGVRYHCVPCIESNTAADLDAAKAKYIELTGR